MTFTEYFPFPNRILQGNRIMVCLKVPVLDLNTLCVVLVPAVQITKDRGGRRKEQYKPEKQISLA
jgi:hypothetical protein